MWQIDCLLFMMVRLRDSGGRFVSSGDCKWVSTFVREFQIRDRTCEVNSRACVTGLTSEYID